MTRRRKGKAKRLLRFVADDPAGLWRKGDAAVDEGWEARDEHGHPATDVRLIRLMRTGEMMGLSDPFRRGLVEVVEGAGAVRRTKHHPRHAEEAPDGA